MCISDILTSIYMNKIRVTNMITITITSTSTRVPRLTNRDRLLIELPF